MTLKTRRDDLFALSVHSPLKDPRIQTSRSKKNSQAPKESLVVDYDPLAKSLGFSHKLSKKVVAPCHHDGEGGEGRLHRWIQSWPMRDSCRKSGHQGDQSSPHLTMFLRSSLLCFEMFFVCKTGTVATLGFNFLM